MAIGAKDYTTLIYNPFLVAKGSRAKWLCQCRWKSGGSKPRLAAPNQELGIAEAIKHSNVDHVSSRNVRKLDAAKRRV
jgi:hypothetical protein